MTIFLLQTWKLEILIPQFNPWIWILFVFFFFFKRTLLELNMKLKFFLFWISSHPKKNEFFFILMAGVFLQAHFFATNVGFAEKDRLKTVHIDKTKKVHFWFSTWIFMYIFSVSKNNKYVPQLFFWNFSKINFKNFIISNIENFFDEPKNILMNKIHWNTILKNKIHWKIWIKIVLLSN